MQLHHECSQERTTGLCDIPSRKHQAIRVDIWRHHNRLVINLAQNWLSAFKIAVLGMIQVRINHITGQVAGELRATQTAPLWTELFATGRRWESSSASVGRRGKILLHKLRRCVIPHWGNSYNDDLSLRLCMLSWLMSSQLTCLHLLGHIEVVGPGKRGSTFHVAWQRMARLGSWFMSRLWHFF